MLSLEESAITRIENIASSKGMNHSELIEFLIKDYSELKVSAFSKEAIENIKKHKPESNDIQIINMALFSYSSYLERQQGKPIMAKGASMSAIMAANGYRPKGTVETEGTLTVDSTDSQDPNDYEPAV